MTDEKLLNETEKFIRDLGIVADFCDKKDKKQYGDIIVDAMQALMRYYNGGKHPSLNYFFNNGVK